MSATTTTTTISLAAYEGVGITFIAITTALVCIRCFVNYQNRLGIDDYLSVVGLCFLIAAFAVNDVITQVFLGLKPLDLISVVIIILVQGTLWFSKAPIIFLYLKLFGIHHWLRYISWATLLVAALVYIGGLIFTLVNCPIDPSKATLPLYQVCATSNTLTGVISGFVSVVVDAIMFALPIPIVLRLKLALSKKIALGLTFSSGILGIVASVISLYYKWKALYGDSTQLVVPIFCFTIEAVVALVVGCAPSIKSFWGNYIMKGSAVKSQPSSFAARSSKASRTPRGPWEGSDEHINSGQSASYIRMESR